MKYRGTPSFKFLMATASIGAVGIALRGALDEYGGMWVWATVPIVVAMLSLFAIGAGLERALLGSVAERVVRLADCPVVVIKRRI